jgi:mitochondrial fission protein ELM1
MNTWIIVDDKKIGTLSQCQGVCETLDIIDPSINFYKKTWLTRFLPNWLHYWGLRLGIISLQPTLIHLMELSKPDIIIGGGRLSAAPTAYLKTLTNAWTLFVQNPMIDTDRFDMVIAPNHDQLEGDNIISITGCFHKINFDDMTPSNPPFIAVILGGDTQNYTYTNNYIDTTLKPVVEFAIHNHMTIKIITSRRTPAWVKDYILNNYESVDMHNHDSPDHYNECLQHATIIVVTGDSVSMICEACFTGKPVYISEIPIFKRKFKYFWESLYNDNYARTHSTILDLSTVFHPVPLNEKKRIAPILKTAMNSFLRTNAHSPQTH